MSEIGRTFTTEALGRTAAGDSGATRIGLEGAGTLAGASNVQEGVDQLAELLAQLEARVDALEGP